MFKLKVVPKRDSYNSEARSVEFSLNDDGSLGLELDGDRDIDRRITFSVESVQKLKTLLSLLEE